MNIFEINNLTCFVSVQSVIIYVNINFCMLLYMKMRLSLTLKEEQNLSFISIFRDMTPYNHVGGNRCFGGVSLFHVES